MAKPAEPSGESRGSGIDATTIYLQWDAQRIPSPSTFAELLKTQKLLTIKKKKKKAWLKIGREHHFNLQREFGVFANVWGLILSSCKLSQLHENLRVMTYHTS